MTWLALSLVLSVVLTVAVNVALRLFPDLGKRVTRSVSGLAAQSRQARPSQRRARVYVPWKAMLVLSLIVTILINLVLWLR